LGAFYSSMTGSGATVYGLFSEQPNLHFQLPKNAIVWKGKLL